MTIVDIARIANVHVSTVSRSLNDSPRVAEKTKARIKKIAQENGFEFNSSARGLITSRVNTIAIILPHNFEQFYVNLFHSALHNYLRQTLEREDFDLIVAFQHNRYSRDNNIIKLIKRKKIDGIIIITPKVDSEAMSYMKKQNVPYIFAHYPPERKNENHDAVYVDHLYGGKLVGEAFINAGYKKIACIVPESRDYEYMLRLEGFKKVLTENGVVLNDEDIWFTPPTYEGGYKEIVKNQSRLKQYDGLFALTDFLALGISQACYDLNYNVPQALGLIGYDDTKISQYMRPALTTVHQPLEQIAYLTCEKLIQVIRAKEEGKGWEKQKISIKPRMVFRESFLKR